MRAVVALRHEPKRGREDGGAAGLAAVAFTGVVHPTLPAVYMAPATGSQLFAVSYDVNGVLTLLGTPQPTGTAGNTNPQTFGVAVDPGGTFLYAVNYGDPAINVYALDPDHRRHRRAHRDRAHGQRRRRQLHAARRHHPVRRRPRAHAHW